MSQELKDQTKYLLRGHRAIFNQNPSKEDLMKHITALQTRVDELSAQEGGEVLAWMNQRGEVITDEQKQRLVNNQGIVGAATATNFVTPLTRCRRE